MEIVFLTDGKVTGLGHVMGLLDRAAGSVAMIINLTKIRQHTCAFPSTRLGFLDAAQSRQRVGFLSGINFSGRVQMW